MIFLPQLLVASHNLNLHCIQHSDAYQLQSSLFIDSLDNVVVDTIKNPERTSSYQLNFGESSSPPWTCCKGNPQSTLTSGSPGSPELVPTHGRVYITVHCTHF